MWHLMNEIKSMTSYDLTINLSSIHLPKDHPVGLKDHISEQSPRWILIGWQYWLSGCAKTDQHYCHYHHNVEHVAHLWGKRQTSANNCNNVALIIMLTRHDVLNVTVCFHSPTLFNCIFITLKFSTKYKRLIFSKICIKAVIIYACSKTHHFCDHGQIWSCMLVDSKHVQKPDRPKDKIQRVDDMTG